MARQTRHTARWVAAAIAETGLRGPGSAAGPNRKAGPRPELLLPAHRVATGLPARRAAGREKGCRRDAPGFRAKPARAIPKCTRAECLPDSSGPRTGGPLRHLATSAHAASFECGKRAVPCPNYTRQTRCAPAAGQSAGSR